MSTKTLAVPQPVVSVTTIEDCIDYIISMCNLNNLDEANTFMYRVFTELNPQYMLTLYVKGKATNRITLQHYVIQQLHQHGVYSCLTN